jgi:hypothetical protein
VQIDSALESVLPTGFVREVCGAAIQAFAGKTHGCQGIGEQLKAASIFGGDGGQADELLGQLQCPGHEGASNQNNA